MNRDEILFILIDSEGETKYSLFGATSRLALDFRQLADLIINSDTLTDEQQAIWDEFSDLMSSNIYGLADLKLPANVVEVVEIRVVW